MLALRRAVVLAAVCSAVLAVSACNPTASRPTTPSPTTPVAMTDAEAFAAAEETYRAYVEALNNVDLADPATFEPVFALTTGDALEQSRKSLSEMHADGWSVAGTSGVRTVVPASDLVSGTIHLAVCLDVSDVRVTNRDGVSVVADRPPVQSLSVFVEIAQAHSQIARFESRSGDPEC